LTIADLKIKQKDTHRVLKVDNYIVAMALHDDASLLAVAFGTKVALLSNWLSGKWLPHTVHIAYISYFFAYVDSGEDVQMSYLSANSFVPKSPLALPQDLYFVDEHTLVVIFIHRVMYAMNQIKMLYFILTHTNLKLLLHGTPLYCGMELPSS
jgi:hypothetical protein